MVLDTVLRTVTAQEEEAPRSSQVEEEVSNQAEGQAEMERL